LHLSLQLQIFVRLLEHHATMSPGNSPARMREPLPVSGSSSGSLPTTPSSLSASPGGISLLASHSSSEEFGSEAEERRNKIKRSLDVALMQIVMRLDTMKAGVNTIQTLPEAIEIAKV
jgi:hypothetical protein